MAFDDTFRLSSHAVILNADNEVLMLKASYGAFSWGLPGGALEPGETIHDALHRECFEELGVRLSEARLTGVYFHKNYNSQAFIFRCKIADDSPQIFLSPEHSASGFFTLEELSDVQRTRVADCMAFSGDVISRKF
jgi:8-oxo-dGTP pyrophosphatase MutT (NUDIX family)